ncbi:hypothetical protein NP233_g2046 [Leucocoprinus birnbaumii]|uniref:Uncharacterized protein n=1 Tax=Leucocoprinus birnbaumii TaxID=56174 RepID=A0AAD5W100_9AGAR|nr:hypothetical protein NP233_g2046 [Leucocoprinus birnbaumii]
MAANRPRPSLINLFDPLANSANNGETPSTPQRREATSEPSDADKENVNSNNPFNTLTMSMFANKIIKPSPHPQPAPLRRRLVDIGDMTLEDASLPDLLLDESIEDAFSVSFEHSPEEDENATLSFRDMVKAATPLRNLKTISESSTWGPSSMARMPLADLILAQATATPLPEASNEFLSLEGPSQRPVLKGSAVERVSSNEPKPQSATMVDMASGLTATPDRIPLPPSPAMTENGNEGRDTHVLSAPERIPSETNTRLETPNPDTSPDDLSPTANISDSTDPSDASSADTSVPITVLHSSPPSSPPMSPSLEPESKPEIADTLSPLPPSTLRLRPPTIAPENRVSVDLHASFQMHMESEEMSFDLLSDKVSFLTAQGGLESFLTTNEDDPSFDMEAERVRMEKALNTQIDAQSVDNVPTNHDVVPNEVPNPPSTPSQSTNNASKSTGANHRTLRKRLSIPIAVSSPRLIDVSPVSKSPLVKPSFSPQRSPVHSTGPVFAPPSTLSTRRRSIHFSTPKQARESAVPEMPIAAPVPKIVRRSRPDGHARTESTPIVTASAAKPERKSSLELGAGLRQLGSSVINPLKTRKPVQIQETPQRTSTEMAPPPSGAAARLRTLAPRSSLTALAQSSGLNARRVLTSEGSQSKSTAPRTSTMGPPPSVGPRRVLVPSSSSLTATQPRPSVGATPSSKVSTKTSTTASASTLPSKAARFSLTSRLPAPRSSKAGSVPTLRRAT